MDNPAQNQTDDNVQSQVQPQAQQVRPLSQPQSQVPQPQVVPVGGVNKEAEAAPVSEFVKPTEELAVKDKEVTEAGVTEVSERPELGKDHEKIGVRPSAETTPVKTEPTGAVQLPMDQAEAEKIVKKGSGRASVGKFFEGVYFVNSVYALAVLLVKHFKKIHRSIFKKGEQE